MRIKNFLRKKNRGMVTKIKKKKKTGKTKKKGTLMSLLNMRH